MPESSRSANLCSVRGIRFLATVVGPLNSIIKYIKWVMQVLQNVIMVEI